MDSLLVVGFPTGALRANCYLLATDAGADCVIVDPGEGAAERITTEVRDRGLTPVAVLATHGHFDHVMSAAELAGAYDLPLRLHPADADLLADRPPMVGLTDGIVELAGLSIGVEHTPGHTPGSVIFWLRTQEGGRLVLTGDTLFAGSVGRTDRAGGSAGELAHSLRTKLGTLSGDTVVLPGHGQSTTIARERAVNPFFSPGAVK